MTTTIHTTTMTTITITITISGWAAVVANLEDIVAAFKGKHETFQQNFNEYLDGRDEKVQLLRR